MNAVDTNVIVYSLDASEPDKQAKAKQLLAGLARTPSETLLLWQVAGELLSWLRKWESAGRVSRVDVEAHFRNFLAMFPLVVPSARLSRDTSTCTLVSAFRTGMQCCSPLAQKPA
jgi:predicted nucleic acid-binding protein